MTQLAFFNWIDLSYRTAWEFHLFITRRKALVWHSAHVSISLNPSTNFTHLIARYVNRSEVFLQRDLSANFVQSIIDVGHVGDFIFRGLQARSLEDPSVLIGVDNDRARSQNDNCACIWISHDEAKYSYQRNNHQSRARYQSGVSMNMEFAGHEIEHLFTILKKRLEHAQVENKSFR